MGAMLGDANSPITQVSDQARKVGPGVTTATQFTTTLTPCTLVEVTAYEGNSAPMVVGGASAVLGTAPGYTDRVGSGVLYAGATKVFAVADASMLYLSGLAADWVTWSVIK